MGVKFKPRAEARCVPGDITVMKISSGFLVGRALARKGPGPWWEYIRIAVSFRQATLLAYKLAKAAGVRAWEHVRGEDYEPLKRWKKRPRRLKTDIVGRSR